MVTAVLVFTVICAITALVVLVIAYDNYKQLEIQREQLDDLFNALHDADTNCMKAFETTLEVEKLVSSSLESISNSLKELAKKQVRSYKKKENSQL